MDRIFITILNMSITATGVLAVVLILRLLFQRMRAQKWMVCALWIAVFFRLLCPVAFTSEYSILQMLPQDSIQSENGTQMIYIAEDVHLHQLPEPIAVSDTAEYPEQVTMPDADASVVREAVSETASAFDWVSLLPVVWMLGVAVFAAYSGYQWYRLRRQVETATLVQDNIYESAQIAGPFVLGLLKPNIYLPTGLEAQARGYILLHEQSHIKRGDLWWKAIAQLALVLHWFNPFVYLAYHLFSQDLEQACDEKVVMQMGAEHKADYCRTLLAMTIAPRQLLTPLAFGESKTKQRVKNILRYGKPAARAWAVFAMIVILVVISCSSNPVQEDMDMPYSWQNPKMYSLMENAFWLGENQTLTMVYELLYPDDPLALDSNILFQETKGRDYKTGCFSIYSRNSRDTEKLQEQTMFQYMEAASFLYQIDDYSAVLYFQTQAMSTDAKGDSRLTLEQRMAYPYTKAGLEQVLQDIGLNRSDADIEALWKIGERVSREERQMQMILDSFSDYDLQSSSIFLQDGKSDSLYVRLDESEELFAVDRSETDYLKTALLIFSYCPQLNQIDMALVGRPYYVSRSARSYETNYWLTYQREELEARYGALKIDETRAVAEQLTELLNRVEPVTRSVARLPEMSFAEEMKRIEFDPVVPYHAKGEYERLRFSLLPGQFPLDDGCYLQMDMVVAGDEMITPKLVESDSSLWIYGEEAQWKQTAEPVMQWNTAEDGMALVRFEGTYQVVVPRWDAELRQALEDLGGVPLEDDASLWTLVYGGNLVFQQLFPHEVLCYQAAVR